MTPHTQAVTGLSGASESCLGGRAGDARLRVPGAVAFGAFQHSGRLGFPSSLDRLLAGKLEHLFLIALPAAAGLTVVAIRRTRIGSP